MKRKTTIYNRTKKNLTHSQLKKIQSRKPRVAKKVMSANKNFKPVINIITRTSNRPVGFEICRNSIIQQTYDNIRHIVSYDGLKDKKYIEESGAEAYFIDKSEIEKKPDIPNPRTGRRFVYNLYFDELFKKVTEGYILILDDDDRLLDKDSIQKMVNQLDEKTDIVIHQMRYPNGRVLPSLQMYNRSPMIGQIGSPCALIKADIAKEIQWDGWKCGDFRYLVKAYSKAENVKWIKEPLIQLGNTGGLGQRVDIKKKLMV